MEIAINGIAFSLFDIIVWAVVGALCAAVAQAIVGYTPGGLLLSIAIGLVGAMLGAWLARQLGLPEILTLSVGGVQIELLWTILGSVLLVFLLSAIQQRPRSRRRRG